MNEKYGMIKHVKTSTADFNIIREHYVFNLNTGIKNIIHYCRKNHIPLHAEYYPINTYYDRIGECFAVYPKVTKGKKYYVVTISYYYDV